MTVQRVSRAEALELMERAPLGEIMSRAHHIRQGLHGSWNVTFVVDTNPNYTNVCITDCTFCSFYRRPGAEDAYFHDPATIADRVSLAYGAGATTVLLQGGHHPDITLDYYESLIRAIQARTPDIHIHPFSPSELSHLCVVSGTDLVTVLKRLWDLGIRTMPGGGAEILVDGVRRKISPKKISSAEWLQCMREAHCIGFRTSATMTYGHVETPADIIDHLVSLRELQDETSGFYAFIPWSFKPGKSPLSKRVPQERLSSYYLRVIAIARIVLDNIPHIQASWFGEGERAGQLALLSGADDFGGVLLEENVLRTADHARASSINAVLEMIRLSGFVPVQRTTLYDHLATYSVQQAHVAPGEPLVSSRREYSPVYIIRKERDAL